ncbi:MAG: hypothetical protein ACOY4I_00965 [Bacillota bacterium]
MECNKINSFQIASAYIGVTIGAGFASGQEVLQFFSFFGPLSLAAIAMTSFLFAFFAIVILRLGSKLSATSHREVVYRSGGRAVGLAVDITITFFLFGSFTAMLAGTGASLNQQFGLPPLYGSLFMAAVALATVLTGLSGIISALSLLVPVMFAGIMTLAGAVLIYFPDGLAEMRYYAQPWEAVIPFWPLSALTYVSYNLVVAVAILAPMGSMAGSGSSIEKGSVAGGIGLGLGITAINLVLLAVPESFGYPVPMSYVAGLFSPLAGALYTLILTAAIYSTAVGGLYGFTARIASPEKHRFKLLAAAVTLGGLIASAIGFTNLVRFLYAGVGIAGFLLLGGLAYQYLRSKLRPGPFPSA